MKKLLLVLLLALAGCGGGGSDIVTPASPIVNVECSVTPRLYGDVTSPTLYKGDFEIPTSNLKLNNSIIRAMDLKDLDPWWSRSSTNTCANKELYLQNVLQYQLPLYQQLAIQYF